MRNSKGEGTDRTQVLVIGGGPSGSTLSTLLARQGYDVLLLEREAFPRFHVGESLIPSTQAIWERLGIAEALQHQGHVFKYAGEFRVGHHAKSSGYDSTIAYFNNVPPSHRKSRPFAYQVVRSEFDHFLLKHARAQGVRVYEKAVVKKLDWHGDRIAGALWKDAEGREHFTQAEVVADCSGRHAFIARQRKLLEPDPLIQTSSVFGHFRGVTRDPGIRQGYFNGYFIENGWVWFIPLRDDIMSVGVVMNKPGTDWWRTTKPEDILKTYINRYRYLRDRFEGAEQSSRVRILRGLPYRSTRVTGDGWILAGDAGFFVDPLYSSGVEIAFHSAELAADAVANHLAGGRDRGAFDRYAQWAKGYADHVFTHMGIIYRLLKSKRAIKLAVNLTGKYANNWDTPILRRVNAFSTGHFDDFHATLYLVWPHLLAMGLGGRILDRLLPSGGWEKEGDFCTEAPLEIPKSKDFPYEYHASPQSAAAELNASDWWVIPSETPLDTASSHSTLN